MYLLSVPVYIKNKKNMVSEAEFCDREEVKLFNKIIYLHHLDLV